RKRQSPLVAPVKIRFPCKEPVVKLGGLEPLPNLRRGKGPRRASKDHRIVIVPVVFPQVKHPHRHFCTFWEDLARILESAANSDERVLTKKVKNFDDFNVKQDF